MVWLLDHLIFLGQKVTYPVAMHDIFHLLFFASNIEKIQGLVEIKNLCLFLKIAIRISYFCPIANQVMTAYIIPWKFTSSFKNSGW